MNDISAATNDGAAGERPAPTAERPLPGRSEGTIWLIGPPRPSARFFRSLSIAVIFMLWALQFTTLTVSHLIRSDGTAWMIVPRLIGTCFGIGISFGILAANRWASKLPLLRRILIAAAGLSIPASLFHALINHMAFGYFVPGLRLESQDYALTMLDWFWFYASLSVTLLALTYGAELSESEERVTLLQTQADAIHLKLLRYQLNPHFLFNTLNSIASLIAQKKAPEAEAMVVSLSDFLRSSLRMDPARQITLGEEIALQTLYLDIERTRFPHRLHISIDVPDELRDALVPNLITQPLIENAIKYGVARSLRPVRLEVIAREADGRLTLEVRDDGTATGGGIPAAQGTRLGLLNISERLRLQFGAGARLAAGHQPEGGYSACIELPLTRL